MKAKETLFLVKYERGPGYVNGQVSIGLFQAASAEAAIDQAVRAMGPWARDEQHCRRCLSAHSLGEMVQVVTLPTKYRD